MTINHQKPIVRYAIVGVGSDVFEEHNIGLQPEERHVVGVCDVNIDAAEAVGKAFNCPHFTDYAEMIKTVNADAIVIISPHIFHLPMALAAFDAGCHVLVEKPVAMHLGEAKTMIAAAEQTGKLLAVNFQQRLRPEIVAAKNIIDSGQLGTIQHVDLKISWTRSAAYYTTSDWRGTWRGEGGGVLQNQAPHDLDIICHFMGLPKQVFGWTRTITHSIEVEDTVQAILEWDSGTLGSLHISTAEAGQPQYIQILGTAGKLSISGGQVQWTALEADLIGLIATKPAKGMKIASSEKTVTLPTETRGKHVDIHNNFYDAIINGAPLVADGKSGSMSLELANALTLSSYSNKPVSLPLDDSAYLNLLTDLQNNVATQTTG